MEPLEISDDALARAARRLRDAVGHLAASGTLPAPRPSGPGPTVLPAAARALARWDEDRRDLVTHLDVDADRLDACARAYAGTDRAAHVRLTRLADRLDAGPAGAIPR